MASLDWIVPSLLSGLVGAIIGAYIVVWIEKQRISRRKKLVATALSIEIKRYQDFFKELFASCPNPGHHVIDHSRPEVIPDYYIRFLERINDYPALAFPGKNGSLIHENFAFSVFYEDIFDFDNDDVITELKSYYDHILIADKYFKRFSDVNTRIEPDGRHLVDNIHAAYKLMMEGKTTQYLDNL